MLIQNFKFRIDDTRQYEEYPLTDASDPYDLDIQIVAHPNIAKELTSGGPCGSGGCQMPQSQQCVSAICSQNCTQTCPGVCG